MIWHANANIIENLYPTLSIIRLNPIMLMAKGHICIPMYCPTSPASRPRRSLDIEESLNIKILVMNPNEVVISATKQPQKRS